MSTRAYSRVSQVLQNRKCVRVACRVGCVRALLRRTLLLLYYCFTPGAAEPQVRACGVPGGRMLCASAIKAYFTTALMLLYYRQVLRNRKCVRVACRVGGCCVRAPLGTFASADSLVLVVEPWGLSNAGAT